VRVDGVQRAKGVDERRAGVHGHGDSQSFGNFLLGGAGFEGGVGMKRDAAIAARGDSYGEGDELADFFAEQGVFRVGSGKGLVALERVGRELGEFGNGFGEFGLIGVPVEEQGFLRKRSSAEKEYSGTENIAKDNVAADWDIGGRTLVLR